MVVSVGLTLVDPLAAVDVNVPGTIEMLVAPLVAQLSLLLCPFVMLDGFAVNELIVGFVAARATLLRPTQASRVSAKTKVSAHRSTTLLRVTNSNCLSIAPPIFIFHLGFKYDHLFCRMSRPRTVSESASGQSCSRQLLRRVNGP
jgi:hypothetical protein